MLVAALTRPDITRAVCRGAGRHLRARGYAIVKEMTFANGRRGDIVALSPSGETAGGRGQIGLEDYRIDGEMAGLSRLLRRFPVRRRAGIPDARCLPEDVGLIVADAYGGEWLRDPPRHPLAPAPPQGADHRLRQAGGGAAGAGRGSRPVTRRLRQRGARLARMRCSVRRCMPRRRAVSETLRLHSS